MNTERELRAIVRSADWLMRALVAARQVDPPDWWIGRRRDPHSRPGSASWVEQPTPFADIDFFDPDDLSEEHEHEVEAALQDALPGVPWDAKDQGGPTDETRRAIQRLAPRVSIICLKLRASARSRFGVFRARG